MKNFTLAITSGGQKIPLAYGPLEPRTDLGMLMASVAGVLQEKYIPNFELTTNMLGGDDDKK